MSIKESMTPSDGQFIQWIQEAITMLPERFSTRLHNVAFFVQAEPTHQQKRLGRVGRNAELFGLYEGYHQAKRLDVGMVLPDRITIFSGPMLRHYQTEQQIKKQVYETVYHEIAHHFGSGERGARQAGKRMITIHEEHRNEP